MQCCLSQRKNSTSRSVLWQKLVTPFLWPLVCAIKDQSFLLKKKSFLFLSNQSLYFGQLRKYIYFIITTSLPFLQRGLSNLTVSNIPAEAFPLVALHMVACYVSCHVEGLKIFRKKHKIVQSCWFLFRRPMYALYHLRTTYLLRAFMAHFKRATNEWKHR